jgi:hypothetical protein
MTAVFFYYLFIFRAAGLGIFLYYHFIDNNGNA